METVFEAMIDGLMAQGHVVTEGLLEPELVLQLRENALKRLSEGNFKAAGIGKGSEQHSNIRRDQILWMEPDSVDPVEAAFFARLQAFVDYLNRNCFTGLREMEFHYASYGAGSFYRRHLDRFRNDNARRYSVICYLNPDWQPGDGGELVIYHGDQELLVEPRGGRVVMFESASIEHEVRETHRTRLSVTGWLK